jgi:hypothetical protein
LLPLRMWAGSAMGVQMVLADTYPQAPKVLAMAMPSDCPGHTTANSAQSDEGGTANTCNLCQLCHPVALDLATSPALASALTGERPRLPAPQFSSADSTLGFKPPIL